ncbi:trehalose utilization protein [Edaphobacter aggregans]|uniref:Trehalose utilization protein n=1 Tax=Edaphobacter aggregans TaxID=570835 RepID=A0A3R9R4Y0_9BACT|nr:ThuA domain-containing protein [Edaphobacter aggregans]RSL18031.1 trehalose utilization protein [Edaphobacter aggregans]
MKCFLLMIFGLAGMVGVADAQQQPAFHVLAFYSETVERDHVDFAHQAIEFYKAAAQRDHFEFSTTQNWDDLNAEKLAGYQLVAWLDDFPHTEPQRAAFEKYMEHGGGWLGFHIAAYNDEGTHWPWFVQFLGGGVFYGNNWPPLPATLTVDDPGHPVVKRIPASFLSPTNEWYIWRPSPRLNRDVKVLITLSPSNYPIGMKDVITGGDLPVVWTNTRYRMLYMNMGHGDRIFTSEVQNRLMEDAVIWTATAKETALRR